MKNSIMSIALGLASTCAFALQPYLQGTPVGGGDLPQAMQSVEQKLTTAGFSILGRSTPKAIPGYGVVVVSDKELTQAITQTGNDGVIGVPIRVGVKRDGSVSFVNLEYWERAYVRADYPKVEAATLAASARLSGALGQGAAFGGDVDASDLAKYHYMIGMEYFEDRSLLKEYASHEEAVKAVRDNLGKGVAQTEKVYEIAWPEHKLAVFGVSMLDPEYGEGWWVNKIGPDHIAALPWEVYVVDGKVMALYGRFRTALAWPDLGMGQFMTIRNHPDATMKMLKAVAGATD